MKGFLLFIFFPSVSYTKNYTQDETALFQQGNPPLTKLINCEVIVLLDGLLKLKPTKELKEKISGVIQNALKQKNTAQIKSTLV